MSAEYGVVKVVLSKDVEKLPAPFPDAAAALRYLRRIVAAQAEDRSGSADWPKIINCHRRASTVTFDARGQGFEASISFCAAREPREHSYRLKIGAAPQVEVGHVEHVENLSDTALKEPPWLHSEANALVPYAFRFAVFTRAQDRKRAARIWFVGITEFSSAPDNDQTSL